jgi:hypothetical protein
MIGSYGILSNFSANLAAPWLQYARRVKGDIEITCPPSYCRVMEAQHRRVGRFSRTELLDRKGVSLSSLTLSSRMQQPGSLGARQNGLCKCLFPRPHERQHVNGSE